MTPERPIGARLAGGGLWPAHIPLPPAGAPRGSAPPALPPAGPPAGATPVSPAAGVPLRYEAFSDWFPWRGVSWSIPYVGFLGYLFAITTYRFPIGNVSMIIGLIGLLLQKEKLRVPGLLKGLGIFLTWCLIGYATTEFGNLVRERLELGIKLWFVALVAANAIRTRRQIRFTMFFWLACFALYPVRGALFNYYLYGESLLGRAKWQFIFENPNDLAAYCVLMISLALGFLVLERKLVMRVATAAGLAVVPFLVLLTKSRGGFLGLAVFVLFALLAQRKRGKAFAIATLIGALVIGLAPSNVLDRVWKLKSADTENLDEVDPEGSAFQRYEIWKVARQMIRENPVVGVGLGAYPPNHRRLAAQPQFHPTARGNRDTHSTYLNVTAETGFVGATIFLLTYLLTLLRINRARRLAKQVLPATSRQLFVLLAGTIGFFVCAVFGSMAHVSFLILHVILMWVVTETVLEELNAVKKGRLVIAPAEPPMRRRRVAR